MHTEIQNLTFRMKTEVLMRISISQHLHVLLNSYLLHGTSIVLVMDLFALTHLACMNLNSENAIKLLHSQ